MHNTQNKRHNISAALLFTGEKFYVMAWNQDGFGTFYECI